MTAVEWFLLVGLLLLTIVLALGHSALVNVRKARLRQLSDEGNKAAQAADRLGENASRLLATTQFMVMLTSLFAGEWWPCSSLRRWPIGGGRGSTALPSPWPLPW